jgi:type IV pilus assembly protein PilC
MSIAINKKVARSSKPQVDINIRGLYKTSNQFKDKQKLRFYSDLHLLLSSGLDLKSSLDILVSQSENIREKRACENILNDIISGYSIADSIRKQNVGNDYEFYAIQIGEESGKIIEVLSEIVQFYKRKIQQKRQITGALTYPLLVLITALIAVIFMLNVIVPMFEEVFQRFDGSLPPITQKIINISDSLKGNLFLYMGVIVLIIFLWNFLNKYSRFRRICHIIYLKIPVFGSLIKKIHYSRFSHTMALLTGAHSPLVHSLSMVEKMIFFIPLKESIKRVGLDITEGNSLYQSLENSGFFEKKFTSLIKASEEVNRLEYAFKQLNNQYNEEIDYKLGILGNLIEPILIIFVGGLVAIILIAMYLPLFQLGTSIY